MAAYFLDSSAIVKRHANETGTTWVVRLTDPDAGHVLYVAQITGVEVVSAVTEFRFDFSTQYRHVEISRPRVLESMDLAERHGLRGYDAVQLAAALTMGDVRRILRLPPLTLISADDDLNAAAAAGGLAVENPNDH